MLPRVAKSRFIKTWILNLAFSYECSNKGLHLLLTINISDVTDTQVVLPKGGKWVFGGIPEC